MVDKQETRLRRKPVYTWHDWFIGTYFFIMCASGLITLSGDVRLCTYSISASILASVGILAVIARLKRVEAVIIVTIGVLLATRAVLLLPMAAIADNTNIFHYIIDIVSIRPLLDGMTAIFPLAVLAAYRGRRGRTIK